MAYLTDNGKNILRKLCYQAQVVKQDLRENGVKAGSYEYQALQQREIAVNTMFDILLTDSANHIADEDMVSYYEYLAKDGQELKLPQDTSLRWDDNLTADGLHLALKLYQEDLIQKQSAWHDGVFENIPNVTAINDFKKCTVNVNYLERQQGFRIAFKMLKIPRQLSLNIEDHVRNGVYTLEYRPNGGNEYKELVNADQMK